MVCSRAAACPRALGADCSVGRVCGCGMHARAHPRPLSLPPRTTPAAANPGACRRPQAPRTPSAAHACTAQLGLHVRRRHRAAMFAGLRCAHACAGPRPALSGPQSCALLAVGSGMWWRRVGAHMHAQHRHQRRPLAVKRTVSLPPVPRTVIGTCAAITACAVPAAVGTRALASRATSKARAGVHWVAPWARTASSGRARRTRAIMAHRAKSVCGFDVGLS